MTEKIKTLYKEVILKHSREPIGFMEREDAGIVLDAYNRLCGDKFRLYFDIVNGKISNLTFSGIGCAISKASTSVLVSQLNKRPVAEAIVEVGKFLQIIDADGGELESFSHPAYEAFFAAREFPEREVCAGLSWVALVEGLEKLSEK